MSDMQEFLSEFFDEFQYRIDQLSAQKDDTVRKEMLYLLVENLILKYENRLQSINSRKGIMAKIFPFLSKSEFDPSFEAEINKQLENLTSNHIGNEQGMNGKIQPISKDHRSKLSFKGLSNRKVPAVIFDNHLHQYIQEQKTKFGYSKTALPPDIDIAIELDLLEGKGQDFIDFFVLPSGIAGIILCDGVSGDGELSTSIAQTIPKHLGMYLRRNFRPKMSLSGWKQVIINGIEYALSHYQESSGATTLLVQLVDPHAEMVYIAYMGDGNIIYFNEELTGFSKLLHPHQNKKGNLTRAVTADGMLGKPSVQIFSAKGGALVISSDGYNLSNGRILRHFYQKVLKIEDLNSALKNWCKGGCQKSEYHPEATDDRSIGVIRW